MCDSVNGVTFLHQIYFLLPKCDESATLSINDYIFPLLLIFSGVIIFTICAAKILGESKRRANEWLAQQGKDERHIPSRKTVWPNTRSS